MNFEEIKNIITQLRKETTCPHCQGRYSEKTISVLSTTKNEGIFVMDCEACGNNVLVSAYFNYKLKAIPYRIHHTKSPRKSISTNELLDIHNFLKEFDGNLSEYLIDNKKE